MFYVQSKPRMRCGLGFDTIKLSDVTDPELHSFYSVTGLFPLPDTLPFPQRGELFLLCLDSKPM